MSASVRDQFQAAAMNVREVGDIDQAITSGVRRRNRTFAAAAVVGMSCAAILAVIFLGAGPGGSEPEPLRPPAPTPSPSMPTPSPSFDSVVRGWPGHGRNRPGYYSLDGDRCGTMRSYTTSPGGAWYCHIGWMHNGYGSGDVEIQVKEDPQWVTPEVDPVGGSVEDGMAVVVAGHDGVYRWIGALQEEWWMFDIEGTTIAIELKAEPGTSSADLAEAHAIIDSMRTEPSDNDLGFRLVFTLTSNDWDSG